MKTTRLCVLALLLAASALGRAWDGSQLAQPVSIDGMVIPYHEFAVFRLPGTRLRISAASPIRLAGSSSVLTELVVPKEPGWYQYRLANGTTGQELLLRVYSLVPLREVSQQGYLGSFRIGHYPTERLRDMAIYAPPAGFIRVDEEQLALRVSPNFTVGQFLSKQGGGFPKYLVLRSALLLKLERIMRALNEAGVDAAAIHVMSGYRTPYYNRAIGNVKYSRHLWGGAADIYIDVNPRDGRMDDLNGDGISNKQDAIWLAGFIDNMSRQGRFATLGGVGIYGSTAAHGPFVHVDVRGYRARW